MLRKAVGSRLVGMRRQLLTVLALAVLPLLGWALGAEQKAPEFQAKQWYNTAPIQLEDLEGKVVLIQVFRTW